MDQPPTLTRSRLLSGVTWMALSQVLMLPTGFLTVMFLTRQIGPEGYGLFALAGTIITWVEWAINSFFSRTTVKFIGETTEWHPIATTILRAQLGVSMLAALVMALGAPAIAFSLHEPALTYLLWLFALEIPLFNLMQGHQNVLTGIGNFGAQATVNAIRWTARLLLIVFLVSVGLDTQGAVMGSVASVVLSLAICRCYIQPSLRQSSNFSARQLTGYATPLFLAALAVQVYEKLDLVALKAMGGTAEEAGIYAVAQNLALLGKVLGPALASVLVASLSQLLSQEKIPQLKALSRSGMRVVLLHLPLVGIVWGSATEIINGLFGEQFAPAAPLFAILTAAMIATIMTAVTSAILIASNRPQWTFAIALPIPIVAAIGHGILIPVAGSIGAAIATLLAASIGALAGVIAVYRQWNILPPLTTLGRSGLVCALAATASFVWPASGLWLLIKLPGLSAAVCVALLLLGEFTAQDRALLYYLLPKRFRRDTS